MEPSDAPPFSPIPPSLPPLPPLVPLLVARDARAAIDFYQAAFDARLIVRYDNRQNGTVSHADLAIGDATFSVTEEARAFHADAPPSLGGSPVVIQLSVAVADESVARAVAAGAEVVFPVQELLGERMARLRDPFGHHWLVREEIERVSPEENQRQRDALFAAFASASPPSSPALARTQRADPTSPTEASVSTAFAFATATELAARIRRRAIGARELTLAAIDRIERLDRQLNAVVTRDFERARERAREADEATARGESWGPLHGVPVTVKEAFDVAGLPTTWGLPARKEHRAERDAEVVARLRAAGAIILGKTNVPAMLGDFQTSNDLHGTTRNPWDPSRGPGGSSGGPAAAVAAGLSALECGSDIGGSIRNPAHYCGVYGHKPTFGLVSMRGHAIDGVPPAPDMAVAGPLARSAADLTLALDVLAAPDPLDGAGWRLALPPARARSLAGLRVAVWPSDPVAPVDDEIAERVRSIASLVGRHGGTTSDRARPAVPSERLRAVYATLVSAVMGAAAPSEAYALFQRNAAALDPTDTSRIASASRALVLDHRSWVANDTVRRALREEWRRFFGEWDVLVCPVMATTAFVHDERPPLARTVLVNGAPQPYFDQVFWASLATLCYLPATAFPVGLARSGLPIGLQAIGPAYGDRTTIGFAELVAAELGGFTPPPDLLA